VCCVRPDIGNSDQTKEALKNLKIGVIKELEAAVIDQPVGAETPEQGAGLDQAVASASLRSWKPLLKLDQHLIDALSLTTPWRKIGMPSTL